ncbi:MAG TPA: VWA domain-containing protein [Bacteroidales bacterium]|nr:VWA domain-containing protein [Bacteroidales bacterium]
MFRFGNTEYLYALAIIPLVILLFAMGVYMRRRSLKRFGDFQVVSQLMPLVSKVRPLVKFILLLLALTSVIFALADPQFGSRLEKIQRKGVEMIIALDVSNSMLAEDIEPSRLERAKRAISQMIDRLHNDKIGLIVFAGEAYVQVPLTTDYSAVKMYLESITTDIVPRQGTAIGSAIDLARKSFDPESGLDKALVVITDGENHQGNVGEAARRAREEGITLHAIGMGTSQGAPIPIREQAGQTIYQKDQSGDVVISKLDAGTLKELASAGKGIYLRASNARSGLNELFDEISQMTRKEIESRVYTDYEHRFQYLIALALFFLFLDLLILERKNKRLMRFNLFKVREGS